jgi:hypothetical protein
LTKPTLNGVVGLLPDQIFRVRGHRCIEEGEKTELAHHGLEEGAPAIEIRTCELQSNRNVSLHADRIEGVEMAGMTLVDNTSEEEEPENTEVAEAMLESSMVLLGGREAE